VLSIKFGDTGYPAILDTVGNFLVHPILQGDNITTSDIAQSDIMTQILEMKNGIIEYKWQNPEDDSIKDKIMVFSELKAYNWFIISTAYKDEFYNPLNKLTNYTIVISLLSMIVIVAITMQVSRMIILPIKQLESTVLQGVNGDLSVRLEVVGHDEISDLRSHFNTFMDTLETQQSNLVNEISEKEKYSTSLQTLNEDLENIVEKRTNELEENYWDNKLSKVELEEFFKAFNQSYDLVLTGLDRSTDLMDMFKLLSDNERYNQTSPMSVKKILRKITNAYSDSQHKIVIDCDDDLIINSHDNVLELIIHQLLKNSLLHAYAEDEVGLITINASVLNNYFLLDVTDNGKGIHAKDMPYVFEPFYKGYKDSERLGLGLSIVQNAVKYILDGNLEIESTSEETTFSVIVPLHGLN
jgi:signal transduction histidine kinase